MTPWSDQVSPTNALPEYPRPQMVRAKWMNLNGLWEFSTAKENEAIPIGKNLPERILVPYPVESPLSGLKRPEERMWYRRTFTIPQGWTGQHVLLHFGAADWKCTVYVNGKEAGGHQGGYGAFSIDITDQLTKGPNELIVNVWAPVDLGHQPVGKQTLLPRGYWYTASSGIWQTVWLEAVPAAHITRLDMTPDVPAGKLRLIVQADGINGQTVEATALVKGVTIGHAVGMAGTEILVPVPKAHLWSPDDPFLYDIKVSLKKGGKVTDQVTGYFGMRSISVGKVAGITRPLLNGKFVFQIGPLDQGFWPDGNYTAPTDEALRFDLEQEKKCGYNMVRKHIKVEPARWYYWADKLGILVYQDMPSMTPDGVLPDRTLRPTKVRYQTGEDDKKIFEAEFKEMIDQHLSSPSIIGWIEFNEGWGQYRDPAEVTRLAKWIKNYDPSRLMIAETGYGSTSAGDAFDWHTYPGPGSPPPSDKRFAGEGEFGGTGLVIKDHSWTPVTKDQYTSQVYTEKYVDMIGRLKAFLYSPGLSYAMFTQITDVENERNGLFTYDRKVFKGDMNAIRAAHQDLIAASERSGQNYSDTFISDFKQGTAYKEGSWEYSKEGYINNGPGVAITDTYFNNFSAQLDLSIAKESEAGLLFRVNNERPNIKAFNGYFAGISSSGLSLSYADKGKWTVIRSIPMQMDPNVKYHLKVDAFGGTIRIYIGGKPTPAIEATDYRSLAGSIGIRATNSSSVFSSLSVNDPFIRLATPKLNGFLIHNSRQNDLVKIDNNVNRDDDALWQITPGLADSKGISFASARSPGYYLRGHEGVVTYEKDDGSNDFKTETTWYRKPGNGTVSYTLYNAPDQYLRYNNNIIITKPDPKDTSGMPSAFVEVR